MQFAGVGNDYPVIKDINAMYKAQGKPTPKEQEISVYYNRGVLIAAVHAEAARNAIKAKGGAAPTGEDVKKGMEAIKDFTLGGLVPPMKITPEDHEGGGWVQIWTVKGGKFVKDGDWIQGLPRRDQEASRYGSQEVSKLTWCEADDIRARTL